MISTPASVASPGHRRMVEELRRIAEGSTDDAYVGDLENRDLSKQIESLPQTAPAETRIDLWMRLAHAESRLGRIDRSLELLDSAAGILDRVGEPTRTAIAQELELRYAITLVRKGEIDNCLHGCNGEACLYPISANAVHQETAGSTQAIVHLERLLQLVPPNSSGYFKAVWLLNLAHMTLGSYPRGVAAKHLLPDIRMTGKVPHAAFANIAAKVGLDRFDLSGGCIVDDFTNDGIDDVVMSTFDPRGTLGFYIGRKDGTFEDATVRSGLAELAGGGLNLIQADYDNDGDLDVFVPRGAWLGAKGRIVDSLLRNEGNGTFVDVTYDVGLGVGPEFPSQVAVWADYDNDGDLDLFVGNESTPECPSPSRLWQNRGKDGFIDVAAAAGVTNMRFAKGAAFGDIDSDGYPDLYVSNLAEPNRLYRNNRDGTFTDIAESAGVSSPLASFPCWFFDFDNDGNQDLFVATYEVDTGAYVASRLGFAGTGTPPALYKGDGKGHFVDVAKSSGLQVPVMTMGSNFGDFDNDGFLDMYLGTGSPGYEAIVPNLFYWNRGGTTFAEIGGPSRTGSLQKGHGVSFADLDHDGTCDLLVRLGGAYENDRFSTAVYASPKSRNAWTSIGLVGTTSNRFGVGARVVARFKDGRLSRSVTRRVGENSSFGGNPLRLHIGVGRATVIDELEVHWPTSKSTQSFKDVPLRRRIEITEHAGEFRVLDDPRGEIAGDNGH